MRFITACDSSGPEPTAPDKPAAAASNPEPARSSRVCLDWQGTYRDVLLCADCEGIETVITLLELEDGSYQRSVRYLGREDYPRRDPRLEGREWVLTEFLGEPVTVAEGQSVPTLAFDGARGRMAGSDGCKRLMGSYHLFERDQIEFGQLAGTLMACPDERLSDRFRKILDKVGDYGISDGKLSLFKGRMAVLARFKSTGEGDP